MPATIGNVVAATAPFRTVRRLIMCSPRDGAVCAALAGKSLVGPPAPSRWPWRMTNAWRGNQTGRLRLLIAQVS
jgi:hypothetical protein